MKKLYLLFLLALFVFTGCDGALQDELVEDNHDTGTNMIHNGDELPGRTMSDQNPNLVNTGSERNYANEIEQARQVINDTNEFTPDAIMINGRDMWVTANTDKKLSAKEKTDAQSRLHKLLTKALPRYDIEVKVNEK